MYDHGQHVGEQAAHRRAAYVRQRHYVTCNGHRPALQQFNVTAAKGLLGDSKKPIEFGSIMFTGKQRYNLITYELFWKYNDIRIFFCFQ